MKNIKSKIKIAIVYGGPSRERYVSVMSKQNIVDNINKDIYEIFEIFIDKNYNIFDTTNNLKIKISKNKNNKETNQKDLIFFLKSHNIDKVFIIIHGQYGEDGTIQKLFEKHKIKFVGSDSKTSSIAINKYKTNKILQNNNINIPKYKLLTRDNVKIILDNYNKNQIQKDKTHKNFKNKSLNNSKESLFKDFTYPIILKPLTEGSSVDLYKVIDNKNLFKVINKVFKIYDKVLLQECIIGREFSCGVIDIKNKKQIKQKSLMPTEIIVKKGAIFDYNAKYTIGLCQEITPPQELSDNIIKNIQSTAINCHQILNCKDISRTDMILSQSDNLLYVLEVNTIPGMTKNSFIPQQAIASGLQVTQLLDILLRE